MLWKYLIIICLCFKLNCCHLDDWKTNLSFVNSSAKNIENYVNNSSGFVFIGVGIKISFLTKNNVYPC